MVPRDFPIGFNPEFVLNSYPGPVLVIDSQRNLRFGNTAASRLLSGDGLLRQVHGRFTTGCTKTDRKLDELIGATDCARRGSPRHARGLRLPQAGTRNGAHLIVHPLSPQPSAADPCPLYLLHIVLSVRPTGTFDPLLRDLFGLTGGEITAALAMVRCGSSGAAAASLSRSPETIRSQLKAVFRKCEIGSTLELAMLINSLGVFGAMQHPVVPTGVHSFRCEVRPSDRPAG